MANSTSGTATQPALGGFGNNGGEIFERGGPYLVNALRDLKTTSALLDEYSPEFTCMLRGWAGAAKLSSAVLGGNGYSLDNVGELVGAANPYIYPENLPRGTVRGGPAGAPGCWQDITHDFWPTPWLVTDSGMSIAPAVVIAVVAARTTASVTAPMVTGSRGPMESLIRLAIGMVISRPIPNAVTSVPEAVPVRS